MRGVGLYCRLKLSLYKFSGACGGGLSYFLRAHGLALIEYGKKREDSFLVGWCFELFSFVDG